MVRMCLLDEWQSWRPLAALNMIVGRRWRLVRPHLQPGAILLRRLSRGSRFGSKYTFPADITAEIVALAEAENAIVNAKYVWEGTHLATTGEDDRTVAGPLAADYEAATAAFEAEFSKAKYRIMEMDFYMRSFLRRNGRPVHGILHQLKRLYRATRYHQA